MCRSATAALVSLLVACGSSGDAIDPDSTTGGPPNPDDQPASVTARVKFKGGQRYAADLADALALDRTELCQELGTIDCVDAHAIALGGVEPYRVRIDEPLSTESVAAPLAIERIALSACGERVHRDLSDPGSALIFADTASTESRREAAATLFDRVLRREAGAWEVDAIVSLYRNDDPDAERTWAQLSCLAVATLSEAIFF